MIRSTDNGALHRRSAAEKVEAYFVTADRDSFFPGWLLDIGFIQLKGCEGGEDEVMVRNTRQRSTNGSSRLIMLDTDKTGM